jgi:hypothetical protein
MVLIQDLMVFNTTALDLVDCENALQVFDREFMACTEMDTTPSKCRVSFFFLIVPLNY